MGKLISILLIVIIGLVLHWDHTLAVGAMLQTRTKSSQLSAQLLKDVLIQQWKNDLEINGGAHKF